MQMHMDRETTGPGWGGGGDSMRDPGKRREWGWGNGGWGENYLLLLRWTAMRAILKFH